MENKDKIEGLIVSLNNARQLSALELNEIRFAGRKTVITPKAIKKVKDNK